jgi:hypothetical protein
MRIGNNDIERARASGDAPTDLVQEVFSTQSLIGNYQIPGHGLSPLVLSWSALTTR